MFSNECRFELETPYALRLMNVEFSVKRIFWRISEPRLAGEVHVTRTDARIKHYFS